MAEPIGGRLSNAMRATVQAAGVSQVDIAEALGTDQPTVSRWARGARRPPLDALPVIEELCRVPKGTILRRAGYVASLDVDIPAAIMDDERLNDTEKRILVDIYEAAARRSAARARA